MSGTCGGCKWGVIGTRGGWWVVVDEGVVKKRMWVGDGRKEKVRWVVLCVGVVRRVQVGA